jgi:hypothetical protein
MTLIYIYIYIFERCIKIDLLYGGKYLLPQTSISSLFHPQKSYYDDMEGFCRHSICLYLYIKNLVQESKHGLNLLTHTDFGIFKIVLFNLI